VLLVTSMILLARLLVALADSDSDGKWLSGNAERRQISLAANARTASACELCRRRSPSEFRKVALLPEGDSIEVGSYIDRCRIMYRVLRYASKLQSIYREHSDDSDRVPATDYSNVSWWLDIHCWYIAMAHWQFFKIHFCQCASPSL
jgi:hypothetical protein